MKTKVSIVVITLFLTGCNSETETKRDVYLRFEDCVSDWGDKELCERLGVQETNEFLAQSSSAVDSNHTSSPLIFWGPPYYSGERSVYHNGNHISPSSNLAMSKGFNVANSKSPRASASPTTKVSPTKTFSGRSSGGFGGRGGGGGGGG